MASEDITYCINDKCEEMKCSRNPKHIKLPILHSYGFLEGTEDCLMTNKDVTDINVGNKPSH